MKFYFIPLEKISCVGWVSAHNIGIFSFEITDCDDWEKPIEKNFMFN